jgi:hypothetical protein
MTALLVGARLADRPDIYPARVELFDQAPNRAALARGIPASECHGAAASLDQLLQIARLVGEPLVEIEFGELCRPREESACQT